MAYVPSTQIFPLSGSHYFDCEYCKGPLGADSTGHCRGCGAPRQAMPPIFNAVTLNQYWDQMACAAGLEQNRSLWEQQNLGNLQSNSLGNINNLPGLNQVGRWLL